MKHLHLILVAFICLATLHCPVSAQDDWTDKLVMPRQDFEYVQAENLDEHKEFVPLPISVLEEKDGWLIFGDARIKKEQAVLLDEAADYYSRLIKEEPSNFFAIGHRAVVWHFHGEYEKAIRDYSETIRIQPEERRAWYQRGIAWHDTGEMHKAIDDYTRAIRIDRRFTDAYINRGVAWKEVGEPEKAIEDYGQAIKINPEDALPYSNRGNAWMGLGEVERAIQDYNKSLQIDSENAVAVYNRGNAWQQQGKMEKAIEDFTEATRIEPETASFWNNLAWLRATACESEYRDGSKAVEMATQACELSDWKNASHLGTLSAAYAEAGDFEMARKYLKQSIELGGKSEIRAQMLRLFEQDKPYRQGN